MKKLLLITLLLQTTLVFGQTVYRVTSSGSSTNSGASWGAAKDLQGALSSAISGDQIWVAAGTYKPTQGTDRSISFEMKNGVAIYGGFDGMDDAALNDRSISVNVTSLSGDIGTENDIADNSCHVVNCPAGLTSTAVLDGFTIQLGNSSLEYEHGGGMKIVSSPTISNCTFVNNRAQLYGGAIYINNGNPSISNCTFTNNQSELAGAIYSNSTSTINNCTFINNNAANAGGAILTCGYDVITSCRFIQNTGAAGGGIRTSGAISIINSIFVGNSNGAVYAHAAPTTIKNCTFSGNPGSGIYFDGLKSSPIKNSIFWGNGSQISGTFNQSDVTYCCIQDGSGTYFGAGNIFINPLFIDIDGADNISGNADDNLSLRNSSPCIGAGTNTNAPLLDILGTTRGTPPDIGAYENSLNLPVLPLIYVNDDATGSDNGTNWTNAFRSLQSALSAAQPGDIIWVAAGIYKPTDGIDRTISFQLKDEVGIYGGFDGFDDAALSDRNLTANLTILSGDIGAAGNSDNSYHVIYNPASSALSNTAILNGFIITGGNADGVGVNGQGGGLNNSSCSPVVTNCFFAGNSATSGGGMYNTSSASILTNCAFGSNSASDGGGIYLNSSSINITNCTFNGNTASGNGSGLYNNNSNPVVKNTIFWGSNNQIYGGTTSNFTYSCIQNGSGSYAFVGNIFEYPLFVDPDGADNVFGTSDDNLRLQDTSPCIGNATSTGAPANDITGTSRGNPPDMGAYENPITPLPRIYVKGNASGNGSGSSWTNAYTTIQPAIEAAVSGQQIWVAAGTYKPTSTTDRTISFRMKEGVAIFGGFSCIEYSITQRVNYATGQANETILSGDIGTQGVNTDNSYHVVYNPSISALTNAAVLDGFTITAGNADGTASPLYYGGGIYNNLCSPLIINCTFAKNNVGRMGAGIYNLGSSPVLINCVFSGNNAGRYGGGMHNDGSSPVITNCTFTGNTAAFDGNGIDNTLSSPVVTNTILWNSMPEIRSDGGSPSFTYSCIQGGHTGTGNISVNPNFIDADGADNVYGTSDDNITLYNRSLCIGAGTASGAPVKDIRGNTRGTPPDMGAYESSLNSPVIAILVKADASGTADGTSWVNAYPSLQSAIAAALTGDQIWVASGTYNPTTEIGGHGDRYKAFQLKNNLTIYGGFDGVSDDELSDRNVASRPTILSGDIGTAGNIADNCYHVINNTSGLTLNNTAILDGFTITGGNANGSEPENFGGGMINSVASPVIRNCSFAANTTSHQGGAIYNEVSTPSFINCVFRGNTSGRYGGGIYNESSSPAITNCTFTYNTAALNGNGIYNIASSPVVKNSIIWNSLPEIYSAGGTPAFTYSCIQGGYAGTGNICTNPLFVDAAGNNFCLQDESPCIGTGTSIGAPTMDILGITRGGIPDMGAFENTRETPLPVELTSFAASIDNSIIQLKWSTITEINNYGFIVERMVGSKENGVGNKEDGVPNSKSEIRNPKFEEVGFVQGSGNSNSIKEYSFADNLLNLNPNLIGAPAEIPLCGNPNLIYRLKQIDNDGSYKYSNEIEVEVKLLPAEFKLEQNYPNPFNPVTTINYSIPVGTHSGVFRQVTLKIYDILGNEVTTLVNEDKEPGYYTIQWNANHLASGTYFCVMQAGEFKAVKKMVLIK